MPLACLHRFYFKWLIFIHHSLSRFTCVKIVQNSLKSCKEPSKGILTIFFPLSFTIHKWLIKYYVIVVYDLGRGACVSPQRSTAPQPSNHVFPFSSLNSTSASPQQSINQRMVAVSSLQQAVPQQKTGELFIKELKIKIIWLYEQFSLKYTNFTFCVKLRDSILFFLGIFFIVNKFDKKIVILYKTS